MTHIRNPGFSETPPEEGKASLSIIIVYYESYDVIHRCIESIRQYPPKSRLEIIVVDNASPDERACNLANLDNRISVHRTPRNLGFGAGCNFGLALASGNFILFLNPDTILQEGTIDRMLEFMNDRPRCGLATCKIMDDQERVQKYSLCRAHSLRYSFSDLFFLYMVPGLRTLFPGTAYPMKRFATEFSPDVISGAFMLFRESVIRELNGFDPRFFLYAEDVDLSVRAAALAQICYNPHARCFHLGHTTLGSGFSPIKYNFLFTSRILFFKKHYGRISGATYQGLLLWCGLLQLIPGILIAPFWRRYLFDRSVFLILFMARRILRRESIPLGSGKMGDVT